MKHLSVFAFVIPSICLANIPQYVKSKNAKLVAEKKLGAPTVLSLEPGNKLLCSEINIWASCTTAGKSGWIPKLQISDTPLKKQDIRQTNNELLKYRRRARPRLSTAAATRGLNESTLPNRARLFNSTDTIKRSPIPHEAMVQTKISPQDSIMIENWPVAEALHAQIGIDLSQESKTKTLNHKVFKLSQGLGLSSTRPRVFLSASEDKNAYASPEGIIFLSPALVDSSQLIDQSNNLLRFILAHEVAHLELGHLTNRIKKQDRGFLATLSRFVSGRGAVIANSTKEFAKDYLGILLKDGYQISQEIEADCWAVQALWINGVDTQPIPNLLASLDHHNNKRNITHPHSPERTQKLMQCVNNLNASPKSVSINKQGN